MVLHDETPGHNASQPKLLYLTPNPATAARDAQAHREPQNLKLRTRNRQ
jgi:hypothetical protein